MTCDYSHIIQEIKQKEKEKSNQEKLIKRKENQNKILKSKHIMV